MASPTPSAAAYVGVASPVEGHSAAATTDSDPIPTKTGRPVRKPATFAVVRASDRQQQRRLLRQGAPLEPVEPERANDWATPLLGCCAFPWHYLAALLVPWVNGAYVAHTIHKSGLLVGAFLLVAYVGTFVCLPGAQQNDGSWHLFVSDNKSDDLIDYRPSDSPAVTTWDVALLVSVVCFATGVGFLRIATRDFYDIRGWSFSDCCAAVWCPCCALAQMSVHARRETAQYRNDGDSDADPAMLPAFVAA